MTSIHAVSQSLSSQLVDSKSDDLSDSECPLEYQPFAYDEDFASDASFHPVEKLRTKETREIDKDAHVFYRRNHDGKMARIIAYKTICMPNRLIRDAVTGIRTRYRACTSDEDFFYSVIVATGETGPEPCVLFYDNPEQYERHFKTKVSPEAKSRWIAKLMEARENASDMDK